MSILIKDTTKEERYRIVMESLEGDYDDLYDDYIAGVRELAEIHRDFAAQQTYEAEN